MALADNPFATTPHAPYRTCFVLFFPGDLWRLDLTSWQWEQLPGRGGPSARSGHRMVLHKNKIILFGGFSDTGKETQ